MPSLRYALLALAVALSAFARGESALACGALPCGQLNDVLPPDRSAGVPLNTEIRVLYFGGLDSSYGGDPSCGLDLRPMRLMPKVGEPIYLTGTVLPRPVAFEAWVIAKHVEPLAANSEYAVQLLLGAGRDPCRCDGREWTTVSTFTSGAGEDHEAPAFAGLEGLDYGERLSGSSTCGGSDLIYVFPEFEPVSDAAPAARYNIYVDGELQRRYAEQLDFGEYGEIFVDCGSSSLSTLTAVVPQASVEVRGIDLAGNESAPNTPLTIEATCSTLTGEQDGTPQVDTDSAPGNGAPTAIGNDDDSSAAPSAASRGATGCSSSSGSGTSSTASMAALLLLFGIRAASRRSIRLPPHNPRQALAPCVNVPTRPPSESAG